MRVAFAVAATVAVISFPAVAQSPGLCATRDVVLETLAKFGESSAGIGILDGTGNLLEFLTNPETGSWTVVVNVRGGPTCMVWSGQGWQDRTPTVVGDPS